VAFAASHSQEFESNGLWTKSNHAGKPGISSEAEIKAVAGEFVEFSVIQSLHPQCVNRFDIVTFTTQCNDELSWQILVEQNSHAD
jgi:hypothetical protein